MPKKTRVAVLYGGRSGEHEISQQSAASVIRNLDRERFEVYPIGIDRNGRWHITDPSRLSIKAKALPIFEDSPMALLPPNLSENCTGTELLPYVGDGIRINSSALQLPVLDVVFPVVHGSLCEDGTLQGLLELADVPYVGCGVLSSAVAMDKAVGKKLAQAAGLPIVPFLVIKSSYWKKDVAMWQERIKQSLGFPCFVKPANSGSSVGVFKVKQPDALRNAIEEAFQYDEKILVEQAIEAREIEVALLDSINPAEPVRVSVPGEIIPHHEFYSYEAKYLDEKGASLQIPADLTAQQTHAVQTLGQQAFAALECEGMARIDFFLDRRTGQWYFNEANTIPGFTSVSMYPKLWEASGIPYQELLSELVELAISRHQRKKSLRREYPTG